MAKLTRKPNIQSTPTVNDFITGVLQDASLSYTVKFYPWEGQKVRDDVFKVYNLRLPEPYLLKLKHISENTPDSMQQFCLKVLLPAIDDKINELTKE